MPILGIGLHVLAAIFFAVHAIRTRQEMYWLMILFLFPLLGSVVYALAIWLPELQQSRHVRRAGSTVVQLIDPGRELRAATEANELSPSVRNQLRLADALVAAGRASESIAYYRRALAGVFAGDPDIRARLAYALLENFQAADARDELDRLIADNPNYTSPKAHQTYARAVAALDDRARAREEFGVLLDSYPGLEARARYARLLQEWGEADRAQALANESLRLAKRLPEHSRSLDRAWLSQLQRVARGS
jgi:hypothetical protein